MAKALLLEQIGYGVNIFEFVAAEKTPKNIILRAMKNAVKKRDQIQTATEYKRLVEMFNFAPALESMLNNNPCS